MAKNFNYDEVPVVETTGGRLKGFLYEGAYITEACPMPMRTASRCQRKHPGRA